MYFSEPEAALDIKASSYKKIGDMKWFYGSTEKKETSYLHIMHNTKTRPWDKCILTPYNWAEVKPVWQAKKVCCLCQSVLWFCRAQNWFTSQTETDRSISVTRSQAEPFPPAPLGPTQTHGPIIPAHSWTGSSRVTGHGYGAPWKMRSKSSDLLVLHALPLCPFSVSSCPQVHQQFLLSMKDPRKERGWGSRSKHSWCSVMQVYCYGVRVL